MGEVLEGMAVPGTSEATVKAKDSSMHVVMYSSALITIMTDDLSEIIAAFAGIAGCLLSFKAPFGRYDYDNK